MKLKTLSLIVCIAFAITALLQVYTAIDLIFAREILLDTISYLWQFCSIILYALTSYFFYSFYKKIK